MEDQVVSRKKFAGFSLSKFIDSSGPVRFVGRWAWLTSIVGILSLFILLIIQIIGTPYGYRVVSQACVESCDLYGQLTAANFQDLQKIGISPDTYATTYVIILWVFAVIAFSVAGFLLWKKPGELLPFCAALLIMSLPSVEGQFVFYSGIFQDYPYLEKLSDFINISGGVTTAYLFLTFPNGKFKAKIFWLLFIVIGIAPSLTAFYLFFFNITFNEDPSVLDMPVAIPLNFLACMVFYIQERNFSLKNTAKYLFWAVLGLLAILITVYLISFIAFLFALIYRLRFLTPREKVPTKWLIYGFTFFNSMLIFFFVIWPLFPDWQTPGSYWFLAFNVAGYFGCGINMTGILISILYANAFDINLVIKRTVVYSSLSLLIIGIYLGSVVVLQELVRLLTGQDSGLAIVGATLVAALLFQPMRQIIQHFVDRRFYRRKYNAARTIAALNANLRNETDLAALTSQVRAVVDETMQPEMITFWVKNKNRPHSIITIK